MRLSVAVLLFLIAGCASEVRQAEDGTHFIKADGPGYPLTHGQFTERANETCPNGYEVLDERTSWGWTITVSGHVRCR